MSKAVIAHDDPMRSVQEIREQWGMKDAFVIARCVGRHRQEVKKCGRVWRIPQSIADLEWRKMTPPIQYEPTRYDMKRVNGELVEVPRKPKPAIVSR